VIVTLRCFQQAFVCFARCRIAVPVEELRPGSKRVDTGRGGLRLLMEKRSRACSIAFAFEFPSPKADIIGKRDQTHVEDGY
jgi:hypothetical protein